MNHIRNFLVFSAAFLFFSSQVTHANEQDNELFYFGTVMTYASMCLKKMNIEDDANSEADARRLSSILLNSYGIQVQGILAHLATIGIQEYEADNGAKCPQMLIEAKRLFNNLGLQGNLFEKAIRQIEQGHNDQQLFSGGKTNKNRQANLLLNQKHHIFCLTDSLHNKFLTEDPDYALADAMLNVTWKMVKKNLDKSTFSSVQKDQREWASSKRDERAASYAASMPPSQAYTKVMQERIAELASLVAREPRLGDYDSESSLFNIFKDKGEYQINGSADNAAGNTCMFEGKLTKDGGWYKVHEGACHPTTFSSQTRAHSLNMQEVETRLTAGLMSILKANINL